ncbi:hypothetical protein K437DRAFT_296104 [Tilletiaria anomala UBC 951]|uniref:Histone deacetylase complex subunit SAP30 Sin3 binding domain-containing protein n=1 Tax=Tilletiaria anomala (strain ATCC 24038 / CBS 436.72 / UBC 951) TaxID=1037660 RepID=A0A066VL27_TILAU|nr:uncharacterized protein K437DRAFT_296104 [Tilletiaria anomala UBC 951]KDN39464.1 hypothetical protein K437DRAFT_296104 [Tilletiaria anomala UBC 951]
MAPASSSAAAAAAAASATTANAAAASTAEGKAGEDPDAVESRVDFTALPTAQLDTYISYYELAPAFPPALDPAPPILDPEYETSSYNAQNGEVERAAEDEEEDGADDDNNNGDGEYDDADRDYGSADEAERGRKRRRTTKAKATDRSLDRQQPPPLGRRAAAALASERLASNRHDPFGLGLDANSSGADGNDYAAHTSSLSYASAAGRAGAAGAGAGELAPGAHGSSGATACPESFFDGDAATKYLAAVAGRHFQSLPQPKEGEIVVGFLYKCRTKDKILKIA